LSQTFQDFEIIVVNDGSTDNTDEVISPYLDDSRIRYLKQTNAGQANAKNTGIRNAEGDFIAFLDADDIWNTTKLDKQISLFSNPQVGVVYSITRYIDEQGNEVSFQSDSKYLAPQTGKVTEFLFFDNFIPFSSSVVRRECFDRVGVFDESIKMGIDWDLWLRISVHYLFRFVDEPLLLYRIGHVGQMSKNLEVRQACTDRIMSNFLEKHPVLLSRKVVRKAKVYTQVNRGYYFRSINTDKALVHYIKALKADPFNLISWIGLIKTVGIGAINIFSKRHV
jgi:glycosyltransferase involved in cell wall biosynthesis